MSADVLREAARLMRERAEGASNGGKAPWFTTDTGAEKFDGYDVWTFAENHHWTVATADFAGDAEHVASWHPVVALAVADLLENEANAWDAVDKYDLPAYNSGRARLLTDLAGAYLGGA